MQGRRRERKPCRFPVVLGCAVLLAACAAHANEDEAPHRLRFREAPLDQVLAYYAELTDRTIIRAPGVEATVTLSSQTPLSPAEVKHAIETALVLHEIALVPMGDRFLKVVTTSAARQEGLSVHTAPPDIALPDADTPMSQVIRLDHLGIEEIQPVLQGLLRSSGHIQPLPRANALLMTDTAANIKRVLELIKTLDQPDISRAEVRVYELTSARAADVAARIQELISDPAAPAPGRQAQATRGPQQAQAIQARIQALEQQVAAAQARRDEARAQRAQQALAAARQQLAQAGATGEPIPEVERGIVRGPVRIVPDERTNTLIVVTEPPNFLFFDRIIDVLDRLMEPEITLRVRHLEYASAEEVAELLGSVISGAETAAAGSSGAPRGRTDRAEPDSPERARGRLLREFLAGEQAAQPGENARTPGIGTLSAETRVLHDRRSNALLLMGRRNDIHALEEVISELDVMLAQVLIEAVIIEVSLSDNLSYGMDWLQRSMMLTRDGRPDAAGGFGPGEPAVGFGGGWTGDTNRRFVDGAGVTRDTPLSSGALTYYLTFYDLNLDTIVRAAATSADARILSTPVVMTTDNTEARIIAGEQRPVVTSTSITTGGVQTSQYQYRNIGIELTVTPRINPQRFVVMEIEQQADNVGEIVIIDGNEVPVITKRELRASVSVPNRSTIVLGGLVNSTERLGRARVPILGDIPIVGNLFRSTSRQDVRTELLVLITPYVMQTPDEARAETRRLHDSSGADRSAWFDGWSDGDLARDIRGEEKPPGHEDTAPGPRLTIPAP